MDFFLTFKTCYDIIRAMNIDIKNCVGKKIVYKTNGSSAILEEGIVEQYINENTVRVGGLYLDPKSVIVCAILSDSINESGNNREQLIKG